MSLSPDVIANPSFDFFDFMSVFQNCRNLLNLSGKAPQKIKRIQRKSKRLREREAFRVAPKQGFREAVFLWVCTTRGVLISGRGVEENCGPHAGQVHSRRGHWL